VQELFVLTPRFYWESSRPTAGCGVFDVFPRLQVTKARRRTTSSLVIISKLKGSPGYVRKSAQKKEGKRRKEKRKKKKISRISPLPR